MVDIKFVRPNPQTVYVVFERDGDGAQVLIALLSVLNGTIIAMDLVVNDNDLAYLKVTKDQLVTKIRAAARLKLGAE